MSGVPMAPGVGFMRAMDIFHRWPRHRGFVYPGGLYTSEKIRATFGDLVQAQTRNVKKRHCVIASATPKEAPND